RVAAFHVAGFGVDHRAARILVALAGRDDGLLPDDAIAAHFFDLVVLVGDDPVAAEELDGFVAQVVDRDRVREGVGAARRIGLLGQILRAYFYVDAALGRGTAIHGR